MGLLLRFCEIFSNPFLRYHHPFKSISSHKIITFWKDFATEDEGLEVGMVMMAMGYSHALVKIPFFPKKVFPNRYLVYKLSQFSNSNLKLVQSLKRCCKQVFRSKKNKKTHKSTTFLQVKCMSKHNFNFQISLFNLT